jgi:hypothetical protein
MNSEIPMEVTGVEESTLTCIGDQRFVILGNHSSGNRETLKQDFPNRLKEWATEESVRWIGGIFIGVQGLEK